MAAFHIWHPAYIARDPVRLEGFVTLGDSFSLARGTDTLVRAALAALGIAAAPRSWSCEAMRSHYFGSYRDDPDQNWQAAWDLVWRLSVELDRTPTLPEPPAWGYFDLDGVDASHRHHDDPESWAAWPCLVIADVPDEEVLAAATALITARFPQAVLTLGRAYGEVPQIRAILGNWPRTLYTVGAVTAEALLSELVAAGASVRFDETLRLTGLDL